MSEGRAISAVVKVPNLASGRRTGADDDPTTEERTDDAPLPDTSECTAIRSVADLVVGSEDCDDNERQLVLFGQARISEEFQIERPLEHILELGFPLEVWDDGTNLIALSNRVLAAYSLVGISSPRVVFRTPTDREEERLVDIPTCLGDPLPSPRIAITTKSFKDGCGDTLGIITSIVRARR